MLKCCIAGISSGSICRYVYGQMRSKPFTFIHFQSKPVLVLEMMPLEDLISQHHLYPLPESHGHYQKRFCERFHVSVVVGWAGRTSCQPSAPLADLTVRIRGVQLGTWDVVTVFVHHQQLCRHAVDNRAAQSGVLSAACHCPLTLACRGHSAVTVTNCVTLPLWLRFPTLMRKLSGISCKRMW